MTKNETLCTVLAIFNTNKKLVGTIDITTTFIPANNDIIVPDLNTLKEALDKAIIAFQNSLPENFRKHILKGNFKKDYFIVQH